ncbi:sporulation inhibitor of replication protein SirA [Aquibacillus koreensis]|uniref:Sporulation inhibitor of replication protein SirA n=1 Tax=Aquibacillus koreensis TaxID=279446 RepID=A0A9X4AIK6_9BACI|nr:sporulation inhibitor of replication protein SirA [Aquibacillus koreensis]MCT2536397.1 sporulation inhibitor of replication protein SirA [Aquibacillus koreensis]MDC3421252.1 sporulation inhibitor of replication protein SirA [Aquibacillus koreensis]
MQKYTIFWVEEEFCYHYYYKSEILYRFFKEYMEQTSRRDLFSQFIYITRVLPYSKLLNHVQMCHKNELKLHMSGKKINIQKDGQYMELHLHKRYMTIYCQSVQVADALLFQPLKVFHPSFFIIENGSFNAGWITPMKKEVLL